MVSDLLETLSPSPEQLDLLALALVRELFRGAQADRAALVEQSRQSALAWRRQIERQRAAAEAEAHVPAPAGMAE